jgi:hypothetical protein
MTTDNYEQHWHWHGIPSRIMMPGAADCHASAGRTMTSGNVDTHYDHHDDKSEARPRQRTHSDCHGRNTPGLGAFCQSDRRASATVTATEDESGRAWNLPQPESLMGPSGFRVADLQPASNLKATRTWSVLASSGGA